MIKRFVTLTSLNSWRNSTQTDWKLCEIIATNGFAFLLYIDLDESQGQLD